MQSISLKQAVNKVLKCSFLAPQNCLRVTAAFICSKELRDPDAKRPAPWPYETKKFTYFHAFFEGTTKRFDENTKLIVVDGNIAAGKTTFAKRLAEAFDMKYIPEPTMDEYYINAYGYDIRELDPLVPWPLKSCDLAKFYEDPHARNCTLFQYRMYMLRYKQYIDALAHILSTGQGVVMDRCVFGDRVFLETMHTCGYISKPARDLYVDIYNNCMEELMRPHLIVYLDISSDTALERIKMRNNPIEVNSKVLNKQYLDCLEYEYKQNYLKVMEKHAELAIYDWSNFGDVEVVVEDIERIDFDRFEKYDDKMKDWRKEDDWEWGWYRRRYCNQVDTLFRFARIFRPRVSEVFISGEDMEEYAEIMKKVPGEKYAHGFNPSLGDKVLFKTGYESYRKYNLFRY